MKKPFEVHKIEKGIFFLCGNIITVTCAQNVNLRLLNINVYGQSDRQMESSFYGSGQVEVHSWERSLPGQGYSSKTASSGNKIQRHSGKTLRCRQLVRTDY